MNLPQNLTYEALVARLHALTGVQARSYPEAVALLESVRRYGLEGELLALPAPTPVKPAPAKVPTPKPMAKPAPKQAAPTRKIAPPVAPKLTATSSKKDSPMLQTNRSYARSDDKDREGYNPRKQLDAQKAPPSQEEMVEMLREAVRDPATPKDLRERCRRALEALGADGLDRDQRKALRAMGGNVMPAERAVEMQLRAFRGVR